MLRLEARAEPSALLAALSPLLALLITALVGAGLFALLGQEPVRGLQVVFFEPLRTAWGLGELVLKATPLILIALGLALCFRSSVWNIGAEGQFILGAIFASGVALQAGPTTGGWIVPALLVAGMLGGALWAAVVALLRDRYDANEILVSLMLVYVAQMLLGYLVHGPWRDPEGYNFPQTARFAAVTQIPRLVPGLRVDIGAVLAVIAVIAFAVGLQRTHAGFRQRVGGLAPLAARYAGYSARRGLWTALLVSGGLAGLAGALEVAGPVGQLTPQVPSGYGFAAIIVAFVGRLQPPAIVGSALLMSLFYIGGELAQSRLGLPKSLTGVFQGLLLFSLLACDTLVTHHVQWVRTRPAAHSAGR